jgi:hypothetical protein
MVEDPLEEKAIIAHAVKGHNAHKSRGRARMAGPALRRDNQA